MALIFFTFYFQLVQRFHGIIGLLRAVSTVHMQIIYSAFDCWDNILLYSTWYLISLLCDYGNTYLLLVKEFKHFYFLVQYSKSNIFQFTLWIHHFFTMSEYFHASVFLFGWLNEIKLKQIKLQFDLKQTILFSLLVFLSTNSLSFSGTVEDTELAEGLIIDRRTESMAGVHKVEKAKIALIQFCVSPPKTDVSVISNRT